MIGNHNGTAEFGGRLDESADMAALEASGHQVLLPAGLNPAKGLLTDPLGAEVHLIVQSHGQGRGGEKLLEQLAYNFANCTPKCEDIQAAVHMPYLP